MDKEILDVLNLIQKDIKSMKTDMESMKTDMESMKTDIKGIKSTQEEHTQILRALVHKTDVISAEQENLKQQVIETKGEVTNMRKDLSNLELITANNWNDIVRLKAVMLI